MNAQGAGAPAPSEGSGSYTTAATSTATRLTLAPRETPQSVSIITRQQLDDQHLTSIASVLERSVGITLSQMEPDRGNASSRGFYTPGIQFDGIPTESQQGMQDYAMLSDTAIYDRVEIIRGATGLLTGLGDPSGAVNLIRKRPTREFSGHVSASTGRWQKYRAEADIAGPLAADGAIRGRLVATQRDTDSHVAGYSNQNALAYGVLEADIGPRTTLTAGVDHLRSDSQGMTYGPPVPLFYSDGGRTRFKRSTTTGADWTFLDNERTTAFIMAEHRFASAWQLKAQYQRIESEGENRMAYLYGAPDRSTGAGVGVFLNSYDLEQTQNGLDIYASGPFSLLGRQHEAVVGWSGTDITNTQSYHPVVSSTTLTSFQDWQNYPEPVFSRGYGQRMKLDMRQDGLYAAARLQVSDPLKLILGSRLSNVDYTYVTVPQTGTPTVTRASHDNEPSPYAGIVYDIGKQYSLYASYTRIFNSQYAKDASGALLDPITGTNYEAGIKGELRDARLNVSAAVFRIEQDNYPEYIGVINGESAYRAVDGARVRGYELEVSGEPLPRWSLSAGFTRMQAESGDGSRLDTDAPSNLLRLTSSHALPGHLDGLRVGGHLSWQSELRKSAVGPNGEDAVQKSYALVDLFGSYRVSEHLRVQANLNNVFDKVYYKAVNSYGYYGEPRNLAVSVRYSF